jgi:8-oxo-dGTP diphosphatase
MIHPAWPEVLEFGVRHAERTYVHRPCAYAVFFDEVRRVAVIENPRGTFLPGGGGEPGETPEVTVCREVREECGYELIELVRLGEAVQFVYTPGNTHGLSKHGVFFHARLGARLGEPTEPEDHLNWVHPAVAARDLTLESQAWVVERFMAGSSRA